MEDIIKENLKYLDKIQIHTKYKIELVKKYIEKWLFVATNAKITKSICFIDAMSNAGVYADGTLGTSTEVLKLFKKFANKHPNIKFRLFCNDYNSKRTSILEKVLEKCDWKEYSNIQVDIKNMDIDEYMKYLLGLKNYFNYEAQAFTFLFVDPYNFGTVTMKDIVDFLKSYKAEMMFNYFSSDINRNIKNQTAVKKQIKMFQSLEGLDFLNDYYLSEENDFFDTIKDNIVENTRNEFYFKYPFRISTNVEIYSILFSTPNQMGLSKFKEVLWELFNGNPNYRTVKEKSQISFWEDDEFQKRSNLYQYVKEAKELLCIYFKNSKIEFAKIEKFIISNTMLKSSQIIKYVLIPLMEEGKVEKCNLKNKKNYKEDRYIFK